MQEISQEALNRVLMGGLRILSDDSVKISASDAEVLTDLKNILRNLLNGTFILSAPDKTTPPLTTKE